MRVGLLTREWPPDVYGGAGVHVTFLARELARRAGVDVDVHCFGPDRPATPGLTVRAYRPDPALAGTNPALQTLSVDLAIAAATVDADIVHSHTWYAQTAGHLAGMLHGIPHVLTTHSLEPHRPWKAEQLAGGYTVSSWVERTAVLTADAVVAVSRGMARDVVDVYPELDPAKVHVIYNGIDTDEYRPDPRTDVLARHGVDPDRPSVVFVGRITRQKGVPHLLAAAADFPPEAQLVLCAGAPDTPELQREVAEAVDRLQSARDGVIWLPGMISDEEKVQLLSHATVFVCPSVYEPLGIVNLEAMACGTAVVASAVGGIPEVVVDGETGLLAPLALAPDGTAADPAAFATALAERVSRLVRDPALAARMGAAGRERAVAEFAWPSIAAQTEELYRSLLR